MRSALRLTRGCGVWVALLISASCRPTDAAKANQAPPPAAQPQPPRALSMGGAKSVTRFFVTSKGIGRGGDLGGLAGADAYCQALAKAEGSGDHTWHAYLSASATDGAAAVNARDRIGSGPWYNALGDLVAMNIEQLHGSPSPLNRELALTERADQVNGVGDTPDTHDILTGSRPDGTAFAAGEDLTCRNWTSSSDGRAQVGHHDRRGDGEHAASWNSAHASTGCSQAQFKSTGGAGLFYCFAVD